MTDLADTRVALKGMRRMIADKMQQSLRETAQLTHFAECDTSALLARKQALARDGRDISLQDLLNYCLLRTLQRHGGVNGRVEDNEIRLSAAVHLSVAIALPGNLLVAPAIFNAEQMSLEELGDARRQLMEKAGNNKLSVKEMTGGTLTVSNLGLSRVKFFTPILNIPQIAIVGFGAGSDRLRLSADGGVESYTSMGLSLTFDHRALDGAPAAGFLSDLCHTIEQADIS
jgi:pyruvate dehydrogenase E2 component (dihydrolipoamide acetyltransferase)